MFWMKFFNIILGVIPSLLNFDNFFCVKLATIIEAFVSLQNTKNEQTKKIFWQETPESHEKDARYGYFEFTKVLSKKPKISVVWNNLFFLDNPAVENWASLAKFKLKSLNL